MSVRKDVKLPRFKSIQEMSDFLDKLDATEFMTPERRVEFDVDIRSRKNLVAVHPLLMKKVRQIARDQGISSESLINLWLSEKLASEAK